MTKDIRLVVYIKNNIMITARESRGLCQSALARAVGVTPGAVGRLENLKDYPLSNRDGEWTKTAKKLSSFLGITEEDLFPEHFRKVKQSKVVRQVEFGALALQDLSRADRMIEGDAERLVVSDELKTSLAGAMRSLTPREQQVLCLRFGINGEEPHTLSEAGDKLFVTQERARQLEARALRKIRHPARIAWLRAFA